MITDKITCATAFLLFTIHQVPLCGGYLLKYVSVFNAELPAIIYGYLQLSLPWYTANWARKARKKKVHIATIQIEVE